jgi:hypothetical protein
VLFYFPSTNGPEVSGSISDGKTSNVNGRWHSLLSKNRQSTWPHGIADIDELGEAVGWDLYCRQLDWGPLQGSAKRLASSDVVVMHVRFNRAFHQRGSAPKGMKIYYTV